MKKILVTGGCGFIGSHTIVDLIEHGYEVYSLDSLVNATDRSLEGIRQITGKQVRNYVVDLCDLEATRIAFQEMPSLDGIIHFAAFKSVGESVSDPLGYYRNNLLSLIHILECTREFGLPHFIFSSSCAVYGDSNDLPVTEESEWLDATSPYGHTKQFGEKIIADFSFRYPKHQFVMLRYFNPAGAHDSYLIGEDARNISTNLVPIITETANGKRKEVVVFGDDYDTRDGSCVRDYIHVMDLARAHTLALEYLLAGKNEQTIEAFNLGSGQGATVLECIQAFEKVTGEKLNYRIGPRRTGDIAAIYANYDRAKAVLGWEPTRDMEEIMRSAWEWEKKR